MKLYIHKMSVAYRDYGTHVETVHGIAWSSDGVETYGFERGKTVADIRAKFRDIGADKVGLELLEGKPVARSCDMNPRGDI